MEEWAMWRRVSDLLIAGLLLFSKQALSYSLSLSLSMCPDWGHRFPKAWIWLQTNSFTATADAESTPLPGASLFFALALTPVPYSEV